MLPDLMRDTVTIRNPVDGAADEFGDATVTWTDVPSDAYVQPAAADENIQDRDTRLTEFDVFLPQAAPVTGLSRLILPNGNEAEIVGDPGEWYNPARNIVFIQLLARTIEG